MATTLRELEVDLITRGHLEKGLESLRDEFAGVFSEATIERLLALGQVEGLLSKDAPEVLFVCVENAGRSQMAAGLMDRIAAGRVHVRSAGSQPAEQINPRVVEAMSEVGVDISKEFPKPMTDEVVRAADAVITMGCGDACPIYPGKRYEDWEVDDPAQLDIDGVRQVRDEIQARVEALLGELTADAEAIAPR